MHPFAARKKRSRRKVVSPLPRKGWRVSRRLRGRKAVTDTNSARKSDKAMLLNFEKQRLQNEKQMYQNLLARYKRDKKMASKKPSNKSSRNLFLVPTGTYGYNDHTLEKKVPELGTYLWGFARGMLIYTIFFFPYSVLYRDTSALCVTTTNKD